MDSDRVSMVFRDGNIYLYKMFADSCHRVPYGLEGWAPNLVLTFLVANAEIQLSPFMRASVSIEQNKFQLSRLNTIISGAENQKDLSLKDPYQ